MKKTAFAFMAVLALAACSQSGRVTKIYGTAPQGLSEVYVTVDELGIDTVITAENGKFAFELPVSLTSIAAIEAGYSFAQFIPDGTELDVDMTVDTLVVKSRQPKKSLHERMLEFTGKSASFEAGFYEEAQKIAEDPSIDEYEKEDMIHNLSQSKMEELVQYNLDIINANSDNVLAAIAFINVAQALSDDEQGQALATMSANVKKLEPVKVLETLYSARMDTVKGKLYKDFSVNSVIGFDKDGQALADRVNLSDIVGHGNYTLVHFWNSSDEYSKMVIPYLAAAYNAYHDSGLDVLSVAVWDNPQASIDTASVWKMNWYNINNAGDEASAAYGFMNLPLLILFSPEGEILERDVFGDELFQNITDYFEE